MPVVFGGAAGDLMSLGIQVLVTGLTIEGPHLEAEDPLLKEV
jgi:hypothetical protein